MQLDWKLKNKLFVGVICFSAQHCKHSFQVHMHLTLLSFQSTGRL
uniref:Uncharacterized protein n=1 Tax=Anguilla anguilla TaxID=7936 RepID=A0A0E9PWA9_ANGAN